MAGSKDIQGFSKTISHEKNERIAHESFHDILVFQKALDKELRKELRHLVEEEKHGTSVDMELISKMLTVKGEYQNMLSVFSERDEKSQRHALIVYADAIQDLMTHLHRRGERS
jgi:hypothetical protein